MLHLPHNWPSYSAGALAGHVLDQIVSDSRQERAVWAMISAMLELTSLTRWQRLRPDLQLAEHCDGTWTCGELTFTYILSLRGDACDRCLWLAVTSESLQVIVPPGLDARLRSILDVYIGRLRPVIYDIGDFLNAYVGQAAIDGEMAYEDAVKRVLGFYNLRIYPPEEWGQDEAGTEWCDEALMIQLPWE